MNFEKASIPDVLKITPRQVKDSRGFFVESFRQSEFERAVGEQLTFVQENCSFSKHQYTVRGLHAQRSPYGQGKLVSCTQGRIRDVVVDIRPNSATFGKSITVDLCAENMSQLWIPEGFLHGFVTLEPITKVYYKCTNYYAPECAINVDWRDSDLNLDWGFDPDLAILSEKDMAAQSFKELELDLLRLE